MSLSGLAPKSGASISASSSARVRSGAIIQQPRGAHSVWLRTLRPCVRFRSERFVQDAGHDLLSIEVGFGDLAAGAAMALVIGVDGFQRGGRLLHGREAKQAFTVGQIGARTR